MCILKLLRLHIIQKHKQRRTTSFVETKNFYNFPSIPFHSKFAFPEMVLYDADDRLEDAETLTTSLIDSMCSDFIFKGNLCDCRDFHEKLKENEKR